MQMARGAGIGAGICGSNKAVSHLHFMPVFIVYSRYLLSSTNELANAKHMS